MQKEIVLDITTGIVVLGSVFGFTHLKKISIKVRQLLRDRKLLKQSERKPIQSEQGTTLPSQQNSRRA